MLKFTKLQGRGNYLGEGGKSKLQKLFFNWKKRMVASMITLIFMGSILPVLISPPANSSSYVKDDGPSLISYAQMEQQDRSLELEVLSYIDDNSFGSKMNAKKFINACYNENFDIILALSQAQIESHFGTRGIAARTNSVFNVGTFDNGVILYRYSHPNSSIYPYISLMKKSYLVNNKSAKDLLKPRSFVNYRGSRYASLKAYEYRVKKTYDYILDNTEIESKWKKYKQEDAVYSREFWRSTKQLHSLIIKP